MKGSLYSVSSSPKFISFCSNCCLSLLNSSEYVSPLAYAAKLSPNISATILGSVCKIPSVSISVGIAFLLYFPAIFWTLVQTFAIGVLEFMEETKPLHELILESFITRFCIAFVLLYSILSRSSRVLFHFLSALFLFCLAFSHSSFQYGCRFFFGVGTPYGMVFFAVSIIWFIIISFRVFTDISSAFICRADIRLNCSHCAFFSLNRFCPCAW